MSKDIYLTKEGYDKLNEELNALRLEKRSKIVEGIKDAVEFGDLRENSEFDAIMLKYGMTEKRIKELEKIMAHAKIIKNKDTRKIGLGSKVKVIINDEEEEFTVVSSYETDANQNKISDLSLIGSSLLNKRVGEIITINTNNQTFTIKITNIS